MPAEFVHLHNHSDYSLLDGAQTVTTLVRRAVELDMDAVALTEHGNMFSAVSFYKEAKKAGIKPIIGCEVYVARESRFTKTADRNAAGWGNNHLVLLAQNYTGYLNLIKLVTAGYLEGFYYRPRIDRDLLRRHSAGLIALSACLQGAPQRAALIANDWQAAIPVAEEYAAIFPDRYYLEIQDHGIPEEKANQVHMARLAQKLGLPLIATNDAHYAQSDHWEAHDIMLCLGTGKDRSDPNRLRYATPEFYLKSQDQMSALFKDYPQVIENSRRIADSIAMDFDMSGYHLPRFPIPAAAGTDDPDEFLRREAATGLAALYPEVTPELQQRLDFELATIKQMGFAGYFLITADFVKYSRDNSIPVGPGRGSAAGSLVSYALGITTVDPLRHNLLFERFLNPERVSMPDIDIDFCIERRGEVIDYIKHVYGKDSVTQIITFGKMKARQVVRDVGRVLGFSFGETDRVAKLIPGGPNVSLEDALKANPELRALEKDERYGELLRHSKVLEGMNRHASIHAAGVVIAPGELTDYIPLYQSTTGDVTSQYDMKCLEDLGLLKMDFLGLRNLTVIDNAIKLLKVQGTLVDIDKIPLDDPEVYKLFAKGLTTGIFQFESSGMREFLKKLKPTVIEDLIAMNALYRPGPMENIDDFIKRKHGKKKIEYQHPALESILKETYGIIVYQEQVMQIAHEIGGMSLAEADNLRRAMGKKIAALMTELGKKFVEGAVAGGTTKKTAQQIYDLIEKFAQYGFNKSHSTAYAYIAYQTAWLKTHYPAAFMSANLTSEMSNIDRVVILINECRKLGIEVTHPDINVSDVNFHPVDEQTISFGLNAIKNVGSKALESIVEVRATDGAFKNLFDLCLRVDSRTVNRKVLESLIMAGALDGLEGTRAQQFAQIEQALKYCQQSQAASNRAQVDIFGNVIGEASVVQIPELPQVEDWSHAQALANEKEVLGMYLSGHPLLKYADDLEQFSTFDFSENVEQIELEKVRVGGTIQELRQHQDRKGKTMAFFRLECLGGSADVTIFSDTFEKYRNDIANDSLVFVQGKPSSDADFGDLKMLGDEIVPIARVRDYYSKRINLRINPDDLTVAQVDELYALAQQYEGKCGLMFHVPNGRGNGKRIISHKLKVSSHKDFLRQLADMVGKKNVWVE
ncbi:MAG: DNA polymerase III subunit alpha [Candidatus Neomarinimicrobiota bacterium]